MPVRPSSWLAGPPVLQQRDRGVDVVEDRVDQEAAVGSDVCTVVPVRRRCRRRGCGSKTAPLACPGWSVVPLSGESAPPRAHRPGRCSTAPCHPAARPDGCRPRWTPATACRRTVRPARERPHVDLRCGRTRSTCTRPSGRRARRRPTPRGTAFSATPRRSRSLRLFHALAGRLPRPRDRCWSGDRCCGYSTKRPSRDQLLGVLTSSDATNRILGPAPLAGFSYRSPPPVRVDVNTIRVPSGDQMEMSSVAASNVNRLRRSAVEQPEVLVALDGAGRRPRARPSGDDAGPAPGGVRRCRSSQAPARTGRTRPAGAGRPGRA